MLQFSIHPLVNRIRMIQGILGNQAAMELLFAIRFSAFIPGRLSSLQVFLVKKSACGS
jgi:hypothetical protein